MADDATAERMKFLEDRLEDVCKVAQDAHDDCISHEGRLDSVDSALVEVKAHLTEQDKGQEAFKNSIFSKIDRLTWFLLTTVVGALVTVIAFRLI